MLSLLLKEIKGQIEGKTVRSVYADRERMEIAITFSNGRSLYAKVRQPHIRMHLSDKAYPTTPDWTNVLKKHRLKRIEQVEGDRIVRMLFERRNPLGETEELELHLEMTGKYGNAILVKGGKVLKILRENLSPTRPLRPGLPFIPYEPRPYRGEGISRIDPHICFVEGKPVLRLEGPEEGKECTKMDSISRAIEVYYSLILSREEEREGKGGRDPQEEIEKLKKRIKEMETRMERAFRIGNRIMERLHILKRGDVIEVEGVEVELDDNPARVAGRFFEEYKRLRRGLEKLQQRIGEIQRKSRMREEGERGEDAGEEPSKPYRIFESPGGFRVYVGKNARGNDYILSSIAGPDDHWFHVKDNPGSHVILRTGRARPSEEDILFAARLALRFSKVASSGKGLVSHTQVKYLRKPAGAPPGMVLVMKEEVIPVRLED